MVGEGAENGSFLFIFHTYICNLCVCFVILWKNFVTRVLGEVVERCVDWEVTQRSMRRWLTSYCLLTHPAVIGGWGSISTLMNENHVLSCFSLVFLLKYGVYWVVLGWLWSVDRIIDKVNVTRNDGNWKVLIGCMELQLWTLIVEILSYYLFANSWKFSDAMISSLAIDRFDGIKNLRILSINNDGLISKDSHLMYSNSWFLLLLHWMLVYQEL